MVQRDVLDEPIQDAKGTGSTWRAIRGAAVGNIIEQYDFALYGAVAALVFGRLFFPEFSVLAGTLAAFSTYAVGFLARPLGALVCGHFGDRVGRRSVLAWTLVGAGGATAAIGLLPTYAAIGVWAPIFLVLLRFVQGFSFGGEYSGAVLMVSESAPAARRGWFTGFVPASSAVGGALSTLVVLAVALLPEAEFLGWGWRVPFVLSIVLVAVGLAIRLRLPETPAFAQVRDGGAVSRAPIVEVVRRHPGRILLAGGVSFGFNSLNYVVLTFLLSYVSGHLGLPSVVALTGLLICLICYGVSDLLFAALSDRVGRRPVVIAGGLAFAAFAFPMFWLVDTAVPIWIWVAMSVATLIGGAIYGPLAALVSELFTTRLRYSGASIGYQVGATVGGGFSPLIATGLLVWSGGSWSVAVYLVLAGVVTAICARALTETARCDLAEVG